MPITMHEKVCARPGCGKMFKTVLKNQRMCSRSCSSRSVEHRGQECHCVVCGEPGHFAKTCKKSKRNHNRIVELPR